MSADAATLDPYTVGLVSVEGQEHQEVIVQLSVSLKYTVLFVLHLTLIRYLIVSVFYVVCAFIFRY